MSEVLVQELPQGEEELVLHERASNEVMVELLYRKVGGEVMIHLIDLREENDLTFPVPSDKAMDAFNHPYSYYGNFQAEQGLAA